MPLLSRRQALGPIAITVAAPGMSPAFGKSAVTAAQAPMPDRYDEPLGIGLEGWQYPAPVRWQQCAVAGQPLRMAFMDVPPRGRPRNRTVVLLHGRSFDSSYWSGPIRDLSEAGFRVVVPDQIGFNKSSKPDLAYSLDVLTDLTINLLGSQQIGQACLIGHSIGAMLATRLTALYPHRVERLVLEAPAGLVDYRRFIPPQSLETLVAAERRQTPASYRAFLRRLLPVLPPAELERYVEWRMRVAQSGEFDRFCKAAALIYQMIYREPVSDQFADIAAPTLVIIGDKDQSAPMIHYASPEMAAKMPSIPQAAPGVVGAMRDAKLVVIPGVGHVPHLEAPEAFRDKVIEFLTA